MILIWFVVGSFSGTAEFRTAQSCQEARVQLVQAMIEATIPATSIYVNCVRK